MTTILLREGWEAASAADYPDDLPPEWRLTYFANEFAAVLVPERDWRAAGERSLAVWAAETPERFRFVLSVGAHDAYDRVSGARAKAALGARFGGWLGHADRLTADRREDGCFVLMETVQGTPPDWAGGAALTAPPALLDDLAAAGDWLRQLAACQQDGRDLAILPGRVSLDTLRRWQTLLHLAGLG